MRILVVGGGVGGLAAARALVGDGHDVTVFERADALRTSGAAFTLWSNGTAVLDSLGVSYEGLGAPIDVLAQRRWDGRKLMAIDVARAAARYGHPSLSMPRRRLIRRLAESLPDGTVELGKRCVGVSQDADGVTVSFDDGTAVAGDLVIGADGHRSVVREHVLGADPTTPSGWATWQGLTVVDTEVTDSRLGLMVLGPEGMCGLLPAGDGLVQWWFDMRWRSDEPMPVSAAAMLKERYGHWASPVAETLAAVGDGDLEFFAHHKQKVPRRWSKGRVTLLGDAAHTMPPTVAQGANQALEDAWALARALRQTSVIDAALRMYERSRYRQARLTSRMAASELTDKFPTALSLLTPDGLMSRFYTRWLKQVSTCLSTPAARPA